MFGGLPAAWYRYAESITIGTNLFRAIVLGVRELLKVPNQRCFSLVSILVGNLISELI